MANLKDALKVLNDRSITVKLTGLLDLGFTQSEADRLITEWRRCCPKAERKPRRAPYTFGVELEVYNVADRSQMRREAESRGLQARFEGYNHVDNDHYYKFVSDSSINGIDPAECVSPILTEGRNGYNSIKAICEALNAVGAKVNRSTGYHVHIGGDITPEQYVNVFHNYKMLQAAINKFLAPSRVGCHWCASLDRYDFTRCTNPEDVARQLHNDRYFAVNPIAWRAHHTIEFRQHQGTTNAAKVLAWAKFCIKLVDYSKTHRIDSAVTEIANIPFITATEIRYFEARHRELYPQTQTAQAV